MNSLVLEHGSANRVIAGSPILNQIKNKCVAVSGGVKKILYIMNFSPSYYSVKFPWEHIIEQINTLYILQEYSNEYSIDVKKEHSGAIQESLFKGLNFINKRPPQVMHEYDLIILESGISTSVIEAAVTNSHIILFTGSEWEDASRESLEMLSRRAHSFNTWSDFQGGLKNILDNPIENLDFEKLNAVDFINSYCNPVTPEEFINTIRTVLKI
jgi:hypothetical protein